MFLVSHFPIKNFKIFFFFLILNLQWEELKPCLNTLDFRVVLCL